MNVEKCNERMAHVIGDDDEDGDDDHGNRRIGFAACRERAGVLGVLGEKYEK